MYAAMYSGLSLIATTFWFLTIPKHVYNHVTSSPTVIWLLLAMGLSFCAGIVRR